MDPPRRPRSIAHPWLVVLALALVPRPAAALCNLLQPVFFESTLPTSIVLVGRDANGVADPLGGTTVIVRNCLHQPLAGHSVEFSFEPGVTVDCSPTHRSVRRLSDANGEARFVIPGSAVPGVPQAATCVQLRVDGVLFGQPIVATPDLDAVAGVGAGDLSAFLQAFLEGDTSVADLDGSGAIGAGDLSVWLDYFSGGASLVTPSPLCP